MQPIAQSGSVVGWSTDSTRLYLMAFCTSLEGQTTINLTAFATSSFGAHSLISTVLVVQSVVYGKFLFIV